MAGEPQSRDIGGVIYEVSPFGSKQAVRVLSQLVKTIGPVMASAQGNGSTESIRGIVEALMLGLDEARIESVITQFSEFTVVHTAPGKSPQLKLILETHFRGQLDLMFSWLEFAIEVNYASFFAEMKRRFLGPQEAKADPSTSPIT